MVNDERDLLVEAFARHEKDTPDPAVVFAEVQKLAKGYRIRRWGLQAAGGAVLSAGLVAGAVQLPQFLPGDNGPTANGISAAAPASPTVTDQQAWEAYFKAGYDFKDATMLAKLWKKDTNDIGAIKAEAGRQLLAGQKLPFEPTPDPPPVPPHPPTKKELAEQKAISKFFAEGYSYTDAENLAKLWHLKGGAYDGKVAGGKKLLEGKKLPIKHQADPGETTLSQKQSAALNKFWDDGYDYDDAVKLAKVWKMNENDIGAVKIRAGKQLLAGKPLPL